MQNFTLTVRGKTQAQAITSTDNTTSTVGSGGNVHCHDDRISDTDAGESGALPSGVTFNPATGVLVRHSCSRNWRDLSYHIHRE